MNMRHGTQRAWKLGLRSVNQTLCRSQMRAQNKTPSTVLWVRQKKLFSTNVSGQADRDSNGPYAVIKVGGEVLSPPHVSRLSEALKILQTMNLPSVVVHGGGPQLNERLKELNIEPAYVKGHRVTDLQILGVARELFIGLNQQFVAELNKNGVQAKGFSVGVFGAEKVGKSTEHEHEHGQELGHEDEKEQSGQLDLGYVGAIKRVHAAEVRECISKNVVPVLTSLGTNLSTTTFPLMGESSRTTLALEDFLNINADVAAREISLALSAQKVLFTSSKGGWTEDDVIISEIDLSEEYDRLVSQDYTGRQGTLLKLLEIKTLLDKLPNGSTVSVCAADDILQNLLPADGSTQTNPAGSTFHLGEQRKAGSESHINVGLIGARGYVGKEFCKLLLKHPAMKLRVASSRQYKGQNVIETFALPPVQDGMDVSEPPIPRALEFTSVEAQALSEVTAQHKIHLWVLALPNGLSPAFVQAIDAHNQGSNSAAVKVIDLSADNRFHEDGSWVYGLPERPAQRAALKTALRISNPGCYATGMQVGLMPLTVKNLLKVDPVTKKKLAPTCFGISGYSGAGTTPSRNNDMRFLNNNLVGYKLVDHIHERECSKYLDQKLDFIPHVGQFFQGIHLTLNAYLEPTSLGSYLTREEIIQIYQDFYAGEKLIKIDASPISELPTVKGIQEKHHVIVSGFEIDHQTGRLVLICLIDNLLKGAATQAIQNINIAFEVEEYTGLPI